MDIAIKGARLKEDFDEVYEAGKQSEYDRFWDSFQTNGSRRNYASTFAGVGWNDETYNPKYEIIATSGSNMFGYATGIISTKVPITIDSTGVLSTFVGCSRLVTIPLLRVTEKVKYTSWFSGCTKLANLIVDGVIANTINFKECPLTLESAISVILHLKDFRDTEYDSTYSCLFSDSTWALLDADIGFASSGDYIPWRDYITNSIWWGI